MNSVIPSHDRLFSANSAQRNSHAQIFTELDALIQRYGDLFYYETHIGRTLFVRHPDHVRAILESDACIRPRAMNLIFGEGLLAKDDDHWFRQRQSILPRMRPVKISRFAEQFALSAEKQMQRWEAYADTGEPVSIFDEMAQIALDSIGQTLLSTDFGDQSQTLIDNLRVMSGYLSDIFLMSSFNQTLNISSAFNQRYKAASEVVSGLIYSLMDERQRLDDKPDDMLTFLLAHVDRFTKKNLSRKHVHDELLTFLQAGHETTAVSMCWVWYALDKNPGCLARLHEIIDRSLAPENSLKLEDLDKLDYLRQVIEETLRLHPAVPGLTRMIDQDMQLGDYQVSGGCAALMMPHFSHRHPEYWENPEVFNPGRFTQSAINSRPSYAYYPFGGARHTCIGKHFAMLEIQIVMATCLKRFRVVPINLSQEQPKIAVSFQLSNGLKSRIERRV